MIPIVVTIKSSIDATLTSDQILAGHRRHYFVEEPEDSNNNNNIHNSVAAFGREFILNTDNKHWLLQLCQTHFHKHLAEQQAQQQQTANDHQQQEQEQPQVDFDANISFGSGHEACIKIRHRKNIENVKRGARGNNSSGRTPFVSFHLGLFLLVGRIEEPCMLRPDGK